MSTGRLSTSRTDTGRASTDRTSAGTGRANQQSLTTRQRLVVANSQAAAILRMSELAMQHAIAPAHAYTRTLLDEPKTMGADAVATSLDQDDPGNVRRDIAALAKGIETRLTVAQICLTDLTDLIMGVEHKAETWGVPLRITE